MTAPGGDAESITWRASFENGISVPAEAAAKSVDDLGDKSGGTSAKLKLLQNEADKTGNKLALMAAKTKLAGEEVKNEHEYVKKLDTEYKKLTRTQDKHTKSTDKLTRAKKELKKAFNEAKKSGQGFAAFLGKLFRIAMMAGKGIQMLTMALGMVGLVGAVGAAIPYVIGLIEQLSSLAAFAFLLPTLIGSLVVSMITLKMAFKGVSDAVGAGFSDDFAAYTEALNKLSPAAANFVRKIVGFAPQLKSLQKSVQESFFAPLVDEVEPLLKTLIPVIGDGATKLAGSFSKIFSVIMQWARSPQGVSAISSFFRTAAMFAETFAAHLRPVLDGFSHVLETVEPIWSRLMKNMGTGMDKFGAWLTKISDDGTLEKWLDMAFTTAKLLGNLFGSLMRVIVAIAGVSKGGALSFIVLLFNTIATFLESPQGQRDLTEFFQVFADIIAALAPALPIVAKILVLLAQAIANLVIGIAPGFIVFLQALADSFASLTANDPDFWVKFGSSISQVLIDLAYWLPGIVTLLGKVITWLSDPGNLEMTLLIIGAVVALINLITFVVPLFTAAVAIGAAFGVAGWEILLIVAAVISVLVALIYIIYEVWTNWDNITSWIAGAWDWLVHNVFERVGDELHAKFVQPFMDAFDSVKKGWEDVKKFFNVDGGGTAPGGGWNPFNWRFAGGPVDAGQSYVTNELGPEKFLSNSGAVSDIGDGSMGKWTAPSSGLVIPAHLTDRLDAVIAASKHHGSDGAEHDPDIQAVLARGSGETTYDQRQYHAHATVHNPASGIDIEAAVGKALKKFRRDEEERR